MLIPVCPKFVGFFTKTSKFHAQECCTCQTVSLALFEKMTVVAFDFIAQMSALSVLEINILAGSKYLLPSVKVDSKTNILGRKTS